MALVPVSEAFAAAAAPAWAITSVAAPTSFSSATNANCLNGQKEECDAYIVTVTNVGTATATGTVVVTDKLPQGTEVTHTLSEYEIEPAGAKNGMSCSHSTRVVTCGYTGTVPPEGLLVLKIEVLVNPEVTGAVTNLVEVESPGVARTVSSPPGTEANVLNGAPALFGVQEFDMSALGGDGSSDVQAGAHPATQTTVLDWRTLLTDAGQNPGIQEPKTEIVDLPAGLVGDAQVAERCSLAAVKNATLHPEQCPPGSQVGYVTVEVGEPPDHTERLYNVPPERGYPAEFAFEVIGHVVALLPRLLPSSGGYVLSVSVPYLPRTETFKVLGARATFFGDPSTRDGSGGGEAFFTDPEDCAAGPLDARVEMDSWVQPERWVSAESPVFAASSTQGVTGCGSLSFHPTIQVTPETTVTDSPSGAEVDLRVPQAPDVPGDLATPDLKDAVVTLPPGVTVDPSAANGLVACQASGPEGIELGAQDRLANENKVEEGEERGPDGLVHPAPGHCPAASTVGEVEVITPLLSEPLKGHVFVAAPQCGGAGQPQCTPQSAEDGQLFGLYVEVAGSGIIVKLKGEVSVNPTTGQLTTRFLNNPQLPFSELKLKLEGGPTAPLATPQTCGTVTATADLTPWSTPYTPDATPSASFPVTGCTGAFSPGFTAGMSGTLNAGAYSPFTLTFTRRDGEQDLSGLTVNMPPGLVGKIAGISECGAAEVAAAQANTGTCPAASRVGTATAAAGAGSAPFWQSGPVYLTGPYNGAPFGLAVVVPANAGPFHLGNIVVRAAIHINPQTAAVTVVADPLPQMIDGVPLRVKTVNVTVGGEGTNFTFNPTGCEAKTVSATVTSAQGAAVPVSSPYAASGCNSLPFKPSFTVSTQGATSRGNGASLDVRIATKQGPDQGAAEESNIRKVDTQLPVALPSRLSTLQKACTEKQFASNPAGCPEASFVGTAVAHTPLLPVALEGPAILVSHGGAAFPDLDLVLQGDGVTIDLVGNTNIEHGITYSKFETAPDAPFSSFELKLPEGPHSILGSYVPNGSYSFCGLTRTVTVSKKVTRRVKGKLRKVTVKVKKTLAASLEMPTSITGQNGAVMTQTTKIAVTGCPSAAAAKAAAAKKVAAAKAKQAGRRR
jgi:hypothetical protein